MGTEKSKEVKKASYNNGGGAVYGLGFVGALVYYIQQSSNFTEGVVGFLKALAWPAFLIHKIFNLLGM